jgi:hypothetical protein
MTLPIYSPFAVQSDKAFYILDTIEADDVALYRKTPAGDDPFTEFSAYRLENGQVLIAFEEHFRHAARGNLVARSEDREEVVNLSLYERLRPHYDLGTAMPSGEKGLFMFLDSQPIHDPQDEWRCDTTSHGPQRYLAPDEDRRTLLSDLSQIKTYEPVLSVNGVAHLVYLHRETAPDMRERVVNGEPVPFVGVSLSEAMKLVHEWATVSEPPFSSTEEIAQDARDFLVALGFYPGLVANQSEMQVARYLQGHNDARRRPSDPQDNTDELRLFLKKRVAHGSLAGALSIYPGSGDVAQAAEIDLMNIESDFASSLFFFGVDPQGHSFAEAERGVAAISDTRGGAKQFMELKVRVLREKQAIALLLRDNPSADI